MIFRSIVCVCVCTCYFIHRVSSIVYYTKHLHYIIPLYKEGHRARASPYRGHYRIHQGHDLGRSKPATGVNNRAKNRLNGERKAGNIQEEKKMFCYYSSSAQYRKVCLYTMTTRYIVRAIINNLISHS